MAIRKTFLPGLELGTHDWQEVSFQTTPPEPMQPGQVIVGVDQLRDLRTLERRICRQLMPQDEFPDGPAFLEGMRPSAIHSSSLAWMARPRTLLQNTVINARAVTFPFDPERASPYRNRWGIDASVRPEDGLTFFIMGEVDWVDGFFRDDKSGIFLCEVSYYYQRYVRRAIGGRVSGLSGKLPTRAEQSPDAVTRARAIASLALGSMRQFLSKDEPS